MHQAAASLSQSISLDFSFGKTQSTLPSSVGFRPSQLGERARPLSSPARRTIFWSVTTRGVQRRADRRATRKWQRNGLKRLNPRPEIDGLEASNHKMWYRTRADRARLRRTSRENDKFAPKKAPKVLQSLDAELKSALALSALNDVRDFRTKSGEAEGDGHRKGRG